MVPRPFNFNFLARIELVLQEFWDHSRPTLYLKTPARNAALRVGDVIYTQGWNTPYQVISGAFSRVYYFRWQGQIVSACADPPKTVNYYLQTLGGEQVVRLEIDQR